jgi:hypothetical protein
MTDEAMSPLRRRMIEASVARVERSATRDSRMVRFLVSLRSTRANCFVHVRRLACHDGIDAACVGSLPFRQEVNPAENRSEIRRCCVAYEKPGLRCAPSGLRLLHLLHLLIRLLPCCRRLRRDGFAIHGNDLWRWAPRGHVGEIPDHQINLAVAHLI